MTWFGDSVTEGFKRSYFDFDFSQDALTCLAWISELLSNELKPQGKLA
jgi:hypothetical protein